MIRERTSYRKQVQCCLKPDDMVPIDPYKRGFLGSGEGNAMKVLLASWALLLLEMSCRTGTVKEKFAFHQFLHVRDLFVKNIVGVRGFNI